MTRYWRLHGVALVAALVALAAVPAVARAHDGRQLAPHDLWQAWDWNAVILLPLVFLAFVYVAGVRRVWRQSARGRGVRVWEVCCFGSGWLVLAIALVSPLHALGGVLFSAHMTQHELMMVVAAPLLVAGRPIVAYVWGLPRPWRRRLRSWTRRTWVQRPWERITAPGAASIVHAAVVGVWHLPGPYQATLASETAHGLQHISFLGTALLFWWAMLRLPRGWYGQSVIYLFATTLWTGALGALLAFAPELWYPQYAATAGAWGLTPLEDQQLGGIIMWIPGGASYLIVALALLARWLKESDRHARGHGELVIARHTSWRSV